MGSEYWKLASWDRARVRNADVRRRLKPRDRKLGEPDWFDFWFGAGSIVVVAAYLIWDKWAV